MLKRNFSTGDDQDQIMPTININDFHTPILQLNLSAGIVRANSRVIDLIGNSEEGLIGVSLFSLLEKQDESLLREQLAYAEHGEIVRFQSVFNPIHHHSYYFYAYIIPIIETDYPLGYYFIIYDFKKISNGNLALPNSFANRVGSIELSIWSFDYEDKRLIYASPEIEKLLNQPIEHIYQNPLKTWLRAIHPDDRDIVKATLRELREGKQLNRYLRLGHPYRRHHWVETSFIPSIDKQSGHIQYVYGVMKDMTHNQESDQQLIENKQFYQTFFESNPDAVMVFDTNGQFVTVNDAFRKMTGYSTTELNGSFIPLVQKIDREWVWQKFKESTTGKENDFYLDVIRKDQTRIKVLIHNQPLIINGNIKGVFAIAEDLTPLFESEEKYRTVVENAHVGIWIIKDDAIQFMNPFLHKKLTIPTLIKGLSHRELVHDEDKEKVTEQLTQLLRTDKEQVVYSYRVHTPNNKIIYFEACATLIQYEGLPAILETLIDVTERTRMEEAMLKKEAEIALSEQRLKALVENAYDAISIRDQHGIITYTSPAFETLFGYQFEAYKSIQDLEFVHPNDVDFIRGKFQECVSNPSKKIMCEARFRHKKGNWIYVEIIMTNKLDDRSINGIVINYRDVTERVEARERIRNLAFHDSLTNTPNRRYFEESLRREIDQAKIKDEQVSLMFLDLDRFKYVNDTLGHRIGDALLKEVAKRVLSCLGSTDLLARMGGDEFVILSSDSSIEKVRHLSERVLLVFEEPFNISTYNLNMTVSIGVSLYPDSGEDADALMRCADMAMYQAKEEGKNKYYIYTPYMNANSLKSFDLTSDLSDSIARNQLYLMYQPIVNALTNEMVAVEALVRWRHPTWGDVSPSEFIPLAEENGYITKIGEWVLEEACKQLKQWHDAGHTSLYVSVNFSTLQLLEKDIINKMVHTFVETGFNPKWLTVEITENTLLKNDDHVLRIIRQLKEMGVRFAIDDFGTGYSSLSYLKNYRMDILKIDKSFIDDIAMEQESFEIVATVVQLARKLNMDIVAEGIETVEQLNRIKSTMCEKVQGYLYSKPLSVADLESLLLRGLYIDYREPNNDRNVPYYRYYSRLSFDYPIEGEMTISQLGGKELRVGNTKILMSDIGAGGLKFTSNVSFSTRSDLVLTFYLTLGDAEIEASGQIVWKQDLDEGVYQYGVHFIVDEREREQLNQRLVTIYHTYQKDNKIGCYLIKDDHYQFLDQPFEK